MSAYPYTKAITKTISNNNTANITMVNRPKRLRIYMATSLYIKALTRAYEMIRFFTVN